MSSVSKRVVWLLLTFSLCTTSLFAQSAIQQILGTPSSTSTPATSSTTAADQFGRTTPYGTVFGFLQAAEAGNYSIAAQYLQMTNAHRQSEGDTLAMKLKVVMDRSFSGNLKPSKNSEGTLQESVPLDRQDLGTMSSGDVETQLELVRVSEPNIGKIWLISSDTLEKVPELYDQVEARQVETRLPNWVVKHQFAGMALWQWFALILLVPVAAGIGWLLLLILQLPFRWWAHSHGQPQTIPWRSVSGPGWLLVATLIHRTLAGYLGMPLLQRHYYIQAATVAIIIGANWILWRVIRWSLRRVRNRALARGHGGTSSLIALGERIVKAAVFVMAAFSIFGVLGFNMSAALAGLGIGGIAIGFGAQQTIANLFGGVSVLGDEVIRVGDVCKFGDRTGTVEDIGLRSTRVRTEERTLLAIPNGTVATINVENLSRRDKILFKTVLGLHATTTSDQVRYVLSEIRSVVEKHPKIETRTVRVRLMELAAGSINIELLCYVLTRDFNEFTEVRESLLLHIMSFVEDSGTNLAVPSQTLYLSGDPASKAPANKSQSAAKQITDATDDKRLAKESSH